MKIHDEHEDVTPKKKRATPTPTPTAALLAAKRAWWAWKCNLRREVTAMGVTQDMWLVDFVEDEPFGRGGVLWRCKGYRENAYLYIYINSQVGLEGLQVFVEQVFSLKISLEYWVHVETERKSWLMRRLAERGWLNHIFFLICKASLIPSYNLYQQEKHWYILTPLEATYPQRLEILGMPISNLFPWGVVYTSHNPGSVENGCSSKMSFLFFLSIFGGQFALYVLIMVNGFFSFL